MMSQNNTDHTFNGSNNQYNHEYSAYSSAYLGEQYSNKGAIPINKFSGMNIGEVGNYNNVPISEVNSFQTMTQYGSTNQPPMMSYQPVHSEGQSNVTTGYNYNPQDYGDMSGVQRQPEFSQHYQASHQQILPPRPGHEITYQGQGGHYGAPTQGIPANRTISQGQMMPPGSSMHPGLSMPPGTTMSPGLSMPPGSSMIQGASMPPGSSMPPSSMGLPNTPYGQNMQGQTSARSSNMAYGGLPSQVQSLNPDNMPSAVEVIEQDKSNNTYNTGSRDKIPPLVTTDFVATDQGTSNPKFIRSTLYNVPTTPDILKNLHIPFALSVTPFAKLDPSEQPIICGETGEKGPIRCIRCKAYMSPLMTFIDGGRRFQCNLCRANTDVTEDYFVHLDQNGNRIDCYTRPELCLGSYELMATKEYCRNDILPQPPAFIFMIDVSFSSVKSGLVSMICKNMKDFIIPYLATDPLVPNSPKPLVGFITYDRVLHFYNMKSNLTKPQMQVISYLDTETTSDLVPIVDGFLVDPDEAVDQIHSLMENIVETFNSNEEKTVILGPVIEAGMEALKAAGNRAGKLFVFHSSLPSAEAPGKLKMRDERAVLGTDKEKSLFQSGSNYYTKLAESCVEAGVSVDLFLTPSAFIDVATLSELPKITGGNLFKYDYFSPPNHGKQFINDLQYAVSAPCAFDAVMRVRTSLGMRVVDFYGNFFMNNTDDVNLACVDANKSVVVDIKHNDKLQEKDIVYIQTAILYTSISGQRRLRIHNISFNVCSNVSQMFKMTDLDTIMNWMSKNAIKVFKTKSIKEVREEVCQKSAQILASYRRHYAEQSKPAELVLPENLKLLPLYANSLLKCDFMQSGTELVTDERAYMCFLFNSLDVKHSQVFLYPRLLSLRQMEIGSNSLPPSIRDNYGKLSPEGAYLIENGVTMFMFIGQNVDPEWLQGVFDCKSPTEIVDRGELPLLNNELSHSMHQVIKMVRSSRARYMKLTIVVQGEKMECAFKKLLVEDHGDRGQASYVEFLCQVHKEIRAILSN